MSVSDDYNHAHLSKVSLSKFLKVIKYKVLSQVLKKVCTLKSHCIKL